MNHALAGSLFVGMLMLLESGWRVGIHRLAQDPDGARAGFGTSVTPDQSSYPAAQEFNLGDAM